MRLTVSRHLLAGMVLLGSISAFAESGTYVPGLAGLQAGTVPGPGIYFADITATYQAHEFRDRNGDKVNDFLGNPVKIRQIVYADFFSMTYVTEQKILCGANYSFTIAPSVVGVTGNVSLGNDILVNSNKTTLSDSYIEPLNLSWHLDRFDFVASYGFYAPTATWKTSDPINTGRDRWSHQFNTGMTAYLDAKKKWSLALINRYEIHHENIHTPITAGDNTTLEWGLGRQFIFMHCDKTTPKGVFDVGPVGFAQWQITQDSGKAAINSIRDRNFGLGLEAKYTEIKWKGATFGLRAEKEFGARNRVQGWVGTFTFAIKY